MSYCFGATGTCLTCKKEVSKSSMYYDYCSMSCFGAAVSYAEKAEEDEKKEVKDADQNS